LQAAYNKAGRAAPKDNQPQPNLLNTEGWSIKKKVGS
jgi:hypothetical protein